MIFKLIHDMDRLTKAETMRISSHPNFLILSFAATLRPTVKIAIPVSAQMSLRSLGPRSYRARDERTISVNGMEFPNTGEQKGCKKQAYPR